MTMISCVRIFFFLMFLNHVYWLPSFSCHTLDSIRQHFSKFSTYILTNWNFPKLIIESTQVCICSHRFLIFRFIKSPWNLSLSKYCIWEGLLEHVKVLYSELTSEVLKPSRSRKDLYIWFLLQLCWCKALNYVGQHNQKLLGRVWETRGLISAPGLFPATSVVLSLGCVLESW